MISRRVIRKFAKEVARRFKPARIVLFGSYAYGEPTPDSDVDLLVVMPCKGQSQDAALDVRRSVDAGFLQPDGSLSRGSGAPQDLRGG
jgi:uncharacterized protein